MEAREIEVMIESLRQKARDLKIQENTFIEVVEAKYKIITEIADELEKHLKTGNVSG